ncbi:universal stress protein [Echinicola sp. CAU 1574]|uniref:Universal stress protein n=1 Tax=Echinicola arenosa TaxID=2774144 RepID=A0ABR9AGL9_9BACT|nr:universal stress protein [Echinicola arenosa]MBD8487644.1 universal stress protein [Echinicola arenosa]
MKILVATDLSDNAFNALEFASYLANTPQSSLTLLFAYTPVYDFAAQTAEYVVNLENQATKVLKSYQKSLIKKGVSTNFIIKQENAISAICNSAEKEAYDLIVLGSQGEGGITQNLLGSTTTEVIRLSNIPTLSIPKHATFKNVSSISLAMELNRSDIIFLGQLITLTRDYRLPYRIIHIKKDREEIHRLTFSELSNYLDDHFPKLSFSFHEIEAKEVNQGLREFTETYPNTLLSMFSKHFSFFDRLLSKSHCAQMAIHSSVPLLVLKSKK